MTGLPRWFRQELPGENTMKVSGAISEAGVDTICRQAKCPNINYCFKNNRAAFLLLGPACTRDCKFCAVRKSGNLRPPQPDEPARVAKCAQALKLDYAVITSVTRDDLPDGGAGVFARTINLIRSISPDILVEALIPDFRAKLSSIERVLAASPYVLAHNIETVNRLYKEVRPMADYRRSLWVLSKAKELSPAVKTKSSLMLGFGERQEEVVEAMRDIKEAGCDYLTLGQYLSPSVDHFPVKEFIGIERFEGYREIAFKIGFENVFSGPLTRSSYQAEELSVSQGPP